MRKNKLLLLLALLLTAATGAWAQTTYTVAGSNSAMFGTAWDASNTTNDMTKNGDGTYSITYTNVYLEDEVQYKVVKDHSWNEAYPDGDNRVITIAEAGTYTLTIHFNPNTHEVYETKPGYTVSLKDGVKDADKWTVKVGEGQAQALPIGGLKGDGSETVTLQYTGRLKVKGVKATSEAAPAEATPALSITSPSVGQVIGSDGKNYAYGSLPTGVTAVAKICYVSGSNGLALALTDEGALDWSTANETCAAHTPAFTGGTWKLASQDEWNNMITTAGNQTDLRDGFSSVGGTNMEENCYWSSSEVDSESAWLYYFGNGQGYTIDDYKDVGYYVRACLAFSVEPAAKEPATVTTAPTGAAIVGVGKTTALVSAGAAEGGTMMYKVTTENTKPASTVGFSADVPTAEGITASGKVYVWYYVKGDDTHSDSEIAATAIEVPVADIIWDITNVSDIDVEGDSYMKEGVTLSANALDIYAGWNDNGDPTTDGISFQVYEIGGFNFMAPAGKAFTKIEMIALGDSGWYNAILGTGWTFVGDDTNHIYKVTWTGSAASTDKLLPYTEEFVGENVISIGFYLVDAE